MEAVIRSVIMAIARNGAAEVLVNSGSRVAAILCAVAAAVLVTASVGCTSAALWIWAEPRLGPVGAPLAVAGALLVLCLAVLIVMRHVLHPCRAPSPPNPAPAPALLLAEATRLFKDHKASVLLAALVAGLAAGRDPPIR